MRILASILLVPALVLSAQDAPRKGYDLTTWGMSRAAVRSMYPDLKFKDVKIDNDPTASLISTKRILLDIPFDAEFIFNNDKLTTVRLSALILRSNGPVYSLHAALIAKYGEPLKLRDNVWQWKSDGTRIVMMSRTLSAQMAVVTYEADGEPEAARGL